MSDAGRAAIEDYYLEERRFPPPEGFAAQAVVTDPSIVERAAARRRGVLGRAGPRPRLVRRVAHGARVGPALRQVVRRGHAERVLQLPRPPRGRRPRRPGRLSTGKASPATPGPSPTPSCWPTCERFSNVLEGSRRAAGRPGGHLHAHDPRAARGHAGLRAHRGAALGRVRRVLRRRPARPDRRRRGQGADHRRRRLAAGRRRGAQGERRRGPGRARPRSSTSSSSGAPGSPTGRRHDAGPRPLVGRPHGRRRAVVPARAHGRRGPALPAVHLGHDGQAQGHHAHHRRLPHPGRLSPTERVFDLTPRPTSTGARPTSAGSPATATSSTDRSPTARPASCTRAPPTPPARTAGGSIIEQLRGHHPLHRADGHPHLHEVGRRSTRQRHDLRRLRLLGIGGRAHQPRSLDVVPGRHRRRALPRRRHLVADRDRRHHDHPAARATTMQAGFGHLRPSGHRRPRSSTTTGERWSGGGGYLTLTRPWPAMLRGIYGDPERYSRPTGAASRAGTSPATGPRSTTTAISGCSAGSTTS